MNTEQWRRVCKFFDSLLYRIECESVTHCLADTQGMSGAGAIR